MVAIRRDRAPLAGEQQHQRQQQTELRLDGEQAEADAGKRRAAAELGEAGDHQRRGEETVLAGKDVHPHGRRDREHVQTLLAPPAVARGQEIEPHADGAPDEVARQIGHEGQRPRHQQEMRRIRPVVMRKFRVELRRQNGVIGVEIEPWGRSAGEGAARAHPGVHEIAADQVAEPIIGGGGGGEIADLEDDREHRRGHRHLLVDIVAGRNGCGCGKAHASALARQGKVPVNRGGPYAPPLLSGLACRSAARGRGRRRPGTALGDPDQSRS